MKPCDLRFNGLDGDRLEPHLPPGTPVLKGCSQVFAAQRRWVVAAGTGK